MIRIDQIKLPVDHDEAALYRKAAREIGISPDRLHSLKPLRRSLDARKKEQLHYVYSVQVEVSGNEAAVLKRCRSRQVHSYHPAVYRLPEPGDEKLDARPVIAGFGPAGMFCGLMLARAGYRPIILERGDEVEERSRRVEAFWQGGALDPESNVQFGEGGAGTFSDGKLNTMVKDPDGRGRLVMDIFAGAGADPAIAYVNNPHIGTDVLKSVVRNIRKEILSLGGEIRFRTRLTDLIFSPAEGSLASLAEASGPAGENRRLAGIVVEKNGREEKIPCRVLILAVGHSARDTFRMLAGRHIPMEAKPFAVGVRVQHPQAQINSNQYGDGWEKLEAASYKLTWQTPEKRGVYSFCMCPGGYVVNASSEPGMLAVNGMSYADRAGCNANSAIVVSVQPRDFGSADALAGMAFQRRLEKRAWEAGKGKIPVQLFGDFCDGRISTAYGEVKPAFCGQYAFGDVRGIFPEDISRDIEKAMRAFGEKIHGFDRRDAILCGVESRTSSPVRMQRDSDLVSPAGGIYPCGEGAGYAGGITSAAMDGIRIAEAVIRRYGRVVIPG